MNYLKFYDLERYLFDEVRLKFAREGRIEDLDFYLILIWKANRAKNRARDRLEKSEAGSFPEAVRRIAAGLREAKEPKEKLRVLMDHPWGFRLATASAILTVLYPEEFTIYDTRVCEVLGCFRELADKPFTDVLWEQYQKLIHAVKDSTPSQLSLRNKDRYLFGKSFYEQARKDAADRSKPTGRF